MWHSYNYKEPQSKRTVLLEHIWFNSSIKVNGEVFKEGVTSELQTMQQIFVNGEPLSHNEVCRKYNCEISWFRYHALVSSIPQFWKYCLRTENLIDNSVHKYQYIKDCAKISAWVYKDLIAIDQVLYKIAAIWHRKIGCTKNINNIRRYFKAIKVLSTRTKLRNFQFRLLHNKVFCNNILVHWRKSESNICNLCHVGKQTIIHLMFECDKVNAIWMRLQDTLWSAGIICNFDAQNVLFCEVHESVNHIANTITLICKQFIYRYKCQDKDFNYEAMVTEIKFNYKIELCIFGKKIKKQWMPVKEVFKL